MHKLLVRLIKRHLPKSVKPEAIEAFLLAVSEAFENENKDRKLLERSLLLASEELQESNAGLQNQLKEKDTSQHQLEEMLVKKKVLLDNSPEAIFSFYPGGKVNEINRAACDLVKIDRNSFKKLSSEESLNVFLKTLINPKKFLNELDRLKEDNRLTLRGCIKTIDHRYFEYHSVPEVLNNEYLGRVWFFRDVTDIRKNQQQLQRQAHYDPLTNLPNRNLLLSTIREKVKNKNAGGRVAVLFIDLDDFKKINDVAGHEEGDECLKEVSSRLHKELRQSDTLGRLGGDEFLLILDSNNKLNFLIDIADRILNLFKLPFNVHNHAYVLGVSMGISLYPQDGDTAEELIRKADMAMYKAKQKGKNTYYFYDNELELKALHRVAIENQLRDAIQNQELILYFQPKISLATGEITGLEALIRWQAPTGKVIYPDSFIHIAEATGLIRYITRWVLSTVCKKLQDWSQTILGKIPISINVTALDFCDKLFLDEVFSIIDEHGIDSNLLEFELTESVFFDDISWVTYTIAQLKAHNIRLSIDDFGTGYSSFSYLQDLDIDHLKIDRSFVQGVDTSERSLSIVKTIIDIGINLGLQVIAEGVETKQELECLYKSGCHQAQGYFFSRPVCERDLFAYAKNINEGIDTALARPPDFKN